MNKKLEKILTGLHQIQQENKIKYNQTGDRQRKEGEGERKTISPIYGIFPC